MAGGTAHGIVDLFEVTQPLDHLAETCSATAVHPGSPATCHATPNKDATAQWNDTRHPVMASAEPGERWLCC